jgi:iron complex outermembrane receptor protein
MGLIAMRATAQSPDASLSEITVVAPDLRPAQRASSLATGSAGSVMDVPASVTTVPGERVRAQGGVTLQDALRNVPGAQADSGFNGSHTQFFILRGASADSGTGSNRVLRDGARLSNYPYVPEFVESMDVLRGPGAAIGVRSEPGGTVNIETRRPQLADFASVSLMVGEARMGEVSVDVNRVLSRKDELAMRIIASRSDASGWRHVVDRLDGLKLGIAKSDGNRYHLRADIEAIDQQYNPDYGIPAIGYRPAAVPRDRQFGEPFADSTVGSRIASFHSDVALSPTTRAALDVTHLEAASVTVKSLLTGSPLRGQAPGTFSRITAWEPDTRRRIDSVTASLTSTQQLGGLVHRIYLGVDYYKELLS